MTQKKDDSKIRLTLLRSPSGCKKNHQASVRGLGLSRIRQTVDVIDTPENRGMVNLVSYLLKVEKL